MTIVWTRQHEHVPILHDLRKTTGWDIGTQGPVPMEGMTDTSDNKSENLSGTTRGFKRAFREKGESQGDLSSGLSIDNVEACDWENHVQESRRRKNPCVLMKRGNQSRARSIASIPDTTGENYLWEEPHAQEAIKGIRKISTHP